MASPEYNDAIKELVVKKLNEVEELIAREHKDPDESAWVVEHAECILMNVLTPPPEPMANAFRPIKEALVTDERFKHDNREMNSAFGSAMNEIARICLPDMPYEDLDMMRRVFRSFMLGLKELTSGPPTRTDKYYIRGCRILSFMTQIKTCLIVWDLECYEMLTELFQILFDIVRFNYTTDVFDKVLTAMTMLMMEGDDIPLELMTIVLSSVKLDNKDVSPNCWELGKRLLEKCGENRLCLCVKETVETLKLDTKDYAEIVSSLCQYTRDFGNEVANEIVATVGPSSNEASKLGGSSNVELEDCTREAKDSNHNVIENAEKSPEALECPEQTVGPSSNEASKLDGSSNVELEDCTPEAKDSNNHGIEEAQKSLEASKCSEQAVQVENDKSSSETQAADNSEGAQHHETDDVAVRRRRGRKPNSLLRPEEGYLANWAIGCQVSYSFSRDVNKRPKKDLLTPTEHVKADVVGGSSGKEPDSPVEALTCEKGIMEEESVLNQQGVQDTSSGQSGKEVFAGVKRGGSNAPKRKRRGAMAARNAAIEIREIGLGGNDSERKVEPSLEGRDSKRSKRGGMAFKKQNEKDAMDNVGGDDLNINDEPSRVEHSSKNSNRGGKASWKRKEKDAMGKMGGNDLEIQAEQSLEERTSKRLKRGGKAAHKQNEKGAVDKMEGSDLEIKVQPSLEERRSSKRSKRGGKASRKLKEKDAMVKVGESSVSEVAKDKQPAYLAPEEEKKSTSAPVDYGEEMVKARIMVWWPMDTTYYTGTVVSFDPETKQHKVVYDDDEEESLTLKDEIWEIFNEDKPRQVQMPQETEVSHTSAARQPTRGRKRGSGRRGGSTRNVATSSSKSVSEGRGGAAAQRGYPMSRESDDEASETYYANLP